MKERSAASAARATQQPRSCATGGSPHRPQAQLSDSLTLSVTWSVAAERAAPSAADFQQVGCLVEDVGNLEI